MNATSSKLSLLWACLLTAAACAKEESAPSMNDATSAPVTYRGRESGSGPSNGPVGRGGGPHGWSPGKGPGAHMACPSSDAPLSDSARTAIERALVDERAAEVRYEAVRQSHGQVMPFRMLEPAERRHAWTLERLLIEHGASVPSAAGAAASAATSSLREECALGAEAERKNIALYDDLLARDLPQDVQCVFSHLRAASRERHLPALERCAGLR